MKPQTHGIKRLVHAVRYSVDGWKAAFKDEEAFRQIVLLTAIGVPLAFVIASSWSETVLLILPLVICIITELVNSAIENVVDRISGEWHPLAKKAKDMGSAAQFTAQLFLVLVWAGFLLARLL